MMPREDHAIHELSEWRDWLAMTQEEFAKEVGVGLASLRTWEQGTAYPRPSARQKLAKYLRVEPWQITYKKGARHKDAPKASKAAA